MEDPAERTPFAHRVLGSVAVIVTGVLLLATIGMASPGAFKPHAAIATSWAPPDPGRPRAAPSMRYGAMSAYDPVRNQVVLFGGSDGTTLNSETYVWNDTTSTWTLKPTVPLTSPPPARAYGAMAFDVTLSKVILFGGVTCCRATAPSPTRGPGMAPAGQLSPTNSPPSRFDYAMAYEANTSKIVLFGGWDD